jgi:hypothetical protein
MGEQLPSATRLERAFDDPTAIRRLIEVNGPFASIASYLPPSATGVRPAAARSTAPRRSCTTSGSSMPPAGSSTSTPSKHRQS